MAVTPLDLLADYLRGQHAKHADINALIHAAQMKVALAQGIADSDAQASAYKRPQPPVIHLTNSSGGTVPPFSVFTLGGALEFDDPCKASLLKFGRQTAGSMLTVYTNGLFAIDSGSQLEAIPIDDRLPQLVRCNPDSIPAIGANCGPDLETFQVCKHRYGLVCLSEPYVVDDITLIWVTRTHEPIAIIGKVSETITAYDPATEKLGTGKAKIYFRVDSDEEKLKIANNTLSADFEVTIWNHHETTFAVNEILTFVQTLGIGLTPVAPGESEVGIAFFNSHAYVSSSDPVYDYPAESSACRKYPAFLKPLSFKNVGDSGYTCYEDILLDSVGAAPGNTGDGERIVVYNLRNFHVPRYSWHPVVKKWGQWYVDYTKSAGYMGASGNEVWTYNAGAYESDNWLDDGGTFFPVNFTNVNKALRNHHLEYEDVAGSELVSGGPIQGFYAKRSMWVHVNYTARFYINNSFNGGKALGDGTMGEIAVMPGNIVDSVFGGSRVAIPKDWPNGAKVSATGFLFFHIEAGNYFQIAATHTQEGGVSADDLLFGGCDISISTQPETIATGAWGYS